MTQKEEQTAAKQERVESEQPSSEAEIYDDFNEDRDDLQSQFDEEEMYLNKLKIQRKRIQELSLRLAQDQSIIQNQIDKNKALTQEIQRLSASKVKQTEVMFKIEILNKEKTDLKEQLVDLRQELTQSASQKAGLIQKIKMDREKYASDIENLRDKLSNKQEEIDNLQTELRNRQRSYQDSISTLKTKISTMEQDYTSIKTEQRSVEMRERDLQSKINQAQLNSGALLKENTQLKEDNFKLNEQLSKYMKLMPQYESLKKKFNSMNNDLKAKERECSKVMDDLRKSRKEGSSEIQTLKIEIRRVQESFETEKSRWQSEWTKEKQSFQMTIDRQNDQIQDLYAQNKLLSEENKRLQEIIWKKENAEKHRKHLLRTEMKEIDKLEKVINQIGV